jgi:UDP-N-acetylmuramoyl-L-alanyl-D-glutamate--2,6-diaminopimelate ligase
MKTKLGDMIQGLEGVQLKGNPDVIVMDIASDSRKVTANSLFACIRGGKVDGHEFVPDAVRRGASAILGDRVTEVSEEVAQVVVPDVRRALAYVSSRFFGNPSEHLTVVGITGTNGKTTTVHYLRSILEAWGESVGAMGTLGHWIGDSVTKDPFTTPEAPEVHRYMKSMIDSGQRYCVMEVSSHAISLARVDNVDFDIVVFTNLTRDHLDFHGDIDDYRITKMKIFGIDDRGHSFGRERRGVVNIGDETGRTISDLTPLPQLTYCLEGPADVRGDIVDLGRDGTTLRIGRGDDSTVVETHLRGRSNAENALAAGAAALLLGVDQAAISAGIAAVAAVPGRMEVIDGPGRHAIVDYAHTPDALRRLLEDVRQIACGRVICVFGCGGDRDRGKRPEMGSIAVEFSDFTIVTSDNPRTEDPIKIIDDITRGIPGDADYEIVPDRAEAISRAVQLSEDGDLIVIAGKGHEDYQIIGTTRTDFDDRVVVRKAFGLIANAKA